MPEACSPQGRMSGFPAIAWTTRQPGSRRTLYTSGSGGAQYKAQCAVHASWTVSSGIAILHPSLTMPRMHRSKNAVRDLRARDADKIRPRSISVLSTSRHSASRKTLTRAGHPFNAVELCSRRPARPVEDSQLHRSLDLLASADVPMPDRALRRSSAQHECRATR